MRHEKFEAWLQLSLYDELNEEEKLLLERHLPGCPICRDRLVKLQELHRLLGKEAPEPSEELLSEAREEFRKTLRETVTPVPWWRRWRRRLFSPAEGLFVSGMPQLRAVAGGVMALAVGLALGYWLFAPQAATVQPSPDRAGSEEIWDRGDMKITNVRFSDPDAADGSVEFSFDAVAPMHIKGSVNDPRVQKVLSYALLNEQNPGVRIRAVNALSAPALKVPDEDVKKALIAALETDKNDGVRKEAFDTLQKYPFDEDIKEAFLHVLKNDPNPGLRISAINSFGVKELGDPDVRDVLKEKMENDRNDYIRIRSRAVLQEVSQQ